jgi:hypothetical protein
MLPRQPTCAEEYGGRAVCGGGPLCQYVVPNNVNTLAECHPSGITHSTVASDNCYTVPVKVLGSKRPSSQLFRMFGVSGKQPDNFRLRSVPSLSLLTNFNMEVRVLCIQKCATESPPQTHGRQHIIGTGRWPRQVA